jgi:hypothetical protein
MSWKLTKVDNLNHKYESTRNTGHKLSHNSIEEMTDQQKSFDESYKEPEPKVVEKIVEKVVYETKHFYILYGIVAIESILLLLRYLK